VISLNNDCDDLPGPTYITPTTIPTK